MGPKLRPPPPSSWRGEEVAERVRCWARAFAAGGPALALTAREVPTEKSPARQPLAELGAAIRDGPERSVGPEEGFLGRGDGPAALLARAEQIRERGAEYFGFRRVPLVRCRCRPPVPSS